MSVPPPSVAPPAHPGSVPDRAGADRMREIVLELPAGRGWRRRPGELVLRGSELHLTLPGVLTDTFRLPGGRVEVAAVDRAAHGREVEHGRFPVLQRLSPTSIVPFEQGFQGWVWTTRSGSGLPTLAESPDALPNLALVFVKPLDGDEVARCFEPAWVRALAARSPLGSPSVPGLLIPVGDVPAAEDAFRRFGVLGPITDREVPPTMRRHLPGDRPADPRIPVDEGARVRTSVAPPGRS
ncbi:MAG: hypothetical protein AVDCRST_MAG38-496 [uncultured Solirubrobacteraceae bacterium]|uniref:Uncharacterized protein n=1 Tax=uncultured Solirubrobacteraceae bacterium TaxID=1162706 RepID=A0A6J4R4K4_9ACTN|nr:MAG: hypothetical protein AVDCRST_MAG38-496 [uncultured Solirubrobacteraceae bacterium]